ncbi:hypothetical protein D3C71_1620420 [compost metagenome]
MPGADFFYFQLVAAANETDWGGFPSGFPRNGGWVAGVRHEIFSACKAFLNMKPNTSETIRLGIILRALPNYRCCRGNTSRITFPGRFGDRV